MFTTSFFGYKKRTSFLTSITLAQISEFSLIIIAQGLLLGHIGQEIFSLTVLLAIITITLTTYFAKYEERIYSRISGSLNFFDRMTEKVELEYIPQKVRNDVILCGYNRIGYNVVKTLEKMKKNFLVIDIDPEIVKNLKNKKIPSIYGDIGNMEVLERLDFKKTKMLISTVPSMHSNLILIKTARKINKKIMIFCSSKPYRGSFRFI